MLHHRFIQNNAKGLIWSRKTICRNWEMMHAFKQMSATRPRSACRLPCCSHSSSNSSSSRCNRKTWRSAPRCAASQSCCCAAPAAWSTPLCTAAAPNSRQHSRHIAYGSSSAEQGAPASTTVSPQHGVVVVGNCLFARPCSAVLLVAIVDGSLLCPCTRTSHSLPP